MDEKKKDKVLNEEGLLKLAKLARLYMPPEQTEKFSSQLSDILEYVKQLESYDVSGVSPMSHVHGSFNVFREDKVVPTLNSDTVKQIAPDSSGRFIRVPIIVEQES